MDIRTFLFPDDGLDALCGDSGREGMGTVLEDELLGGAAFVDEEQGSATVRIPERQVSNTGWDVAASLDSHRTRLDHLRGMGEIVVVALAGTDCASAGIEGHDSEAGGAAARPVRTAVLVQHQVPQGNSLAVVLHGLEEDALEVVDEAGFELVVPGAYGCLGEVNLLLRSGGMYAAQGAHGAAVVVPGGTGYKPGCLRIVVDIQRVVLLAGHIVVIVVVVEHQDFGVDAGLLECRTEGCLDEVALLLPGHIHRH